ncbi:hypothetical protein HMN09_00872300 [Mycena chlorophos]|uniref:Uncharacterized protein n=1 Tax=Mycena chlorophos TaxID=658473 RepID=A0A8H6W4C4_MYCCL|nr:hypothetical protein HMN09_00872300 [Mycena chlorophos]
MSFSQHIATARSLPLLGFPRLRLFVQEPGQQPRDVTASPAHQRILDLVRVAFTHIVSGVAASSTLLHTINLLDIVFTDLQFANREFAWAFVDKGEDGDKIYFQLAIERVLRHNSQPPASCRDADFVRAALEYLMVLVAIHEGVHAASKKLLLKLVTPEIDGFEDDYDSQNQGSEAGATYERRLMRFMTQVIWRRGDVRTDDLEHWMWHIDSVIAARKNEIRNQSFDKQTLIDITASFGYDPVWVPDLRETPAEYVFNDNTHKRFRGASPLSLLGSPSADEEVKRASEEDTAGLSILNSEEYLVAPLCGGHTQRVYLPSVSTSGDSVPPPIAAQGLGFIGLEMPYV